MSSGWTVAAVLGLAAAVSLQADEAWAPVPADLRHPPLGGIAIPAAIGPERVRLVGGHPPTPLPAQPQVWRLSENDWLPASRAVAAVRSIGSGPDPATPAGAVRLEAADRIYAEATPLGSDRPDGELRNPWMVRLAGRPRTIPFTLDCGGVAVGGAGGAVAWINGRVLRRGDRLGPFRIEAVRRDEVMLELHGGRYVLPRGRKATVAVVAP